LELAVLSGMFAMWMVDVEFFFSLERVGDVFMSDGLFFTEDVQTRYP
jgi:hypothetical protein